MHTPGPWQVIEDNHDDYEEGHIAIEADEAGRDVAVVVSTNPESQVDLSPEEWANARLIAAAPELLEALRLLVMLDQSSIDDGDWQRARAAIAKAEGRG